MYILDIGQKYIENFNYYNSTTFLEINGIYGLFDYSSIQLMDRTEIISFYKVLTFIQIQMIQKAFF